MTQGGNSACMAQGGNSASMARVMEGIDKAVQFRSGPGSALATHINMHDFEIYEYILTNT